DRIRAVRNRYRSSPMIVYSVLAPQTLPPLVELGRDGLEQLVLYGLDDDPSHLRQMLERQPGILLSERLLDRLRRPLARVPSGVSHAVERLLPHPDCARARGAPPRGSWARARGSWGRTRPCASRRTRSTRSRATCASPTPTR